MAAERLWSFARTFWRRLRTRLSPVFVEHHPQFVVADSAEVSERPIFVIGTHRSGTTLVRRILDSHPHVACPPESQFMAHFFNLAMHPRAMTGLEDMGFAEKEALKLLRVSAAQFHEIYRRSKNKPRWADKTPEYALCLDGLSKLFGSHAQFVMVFRHPLDVACSLWARRVHFGTKTTGDRLVDACEYVLEAGLAEIEFLARHSTESHVLFYDDLMAHPEPILRELCEFLEEPWDERMLRHDEVPHDIGLEDPIARVTRGFKPSAGNWREWSAEQRQVAISILQPLMDRLGYTVDDVRRRASAATVPLQADSRRHVA